MSEAVDGAVAAAEALIKKRIEERDQERLADDFVASLSKAFVAQSADRQGGSR
jgi:F0F1-type ATP synthase membrane subunit b/b'